MFLNENKGLAQNDADVHKCDKIDKKTDIRWEMREGVLGVDQNKQAFEATRQWPAAEKDNGAVAQNCEHFDNVPHCDNCENSEVEDDKEQCCARGRGGSSGESPLLWPQEPENKVWAQNYAKN